MDPSWDMFQLDDGLRLTRQQKENQETGIIPFDILWPPTIFVGEIPKT